MQIKNVCVPISCKFCCGMIFINFSRIFADEEEKERKIHIEIKPVNATTGMSASIDELIATVGTFSLSPDPQRTVNILNTMFCTLIFCNR